MWLLWHCRHTADTANAGGCFPPSLRLSSCLSSIQLISLPLCLTFHVYSQSHHSDFTTMSPCLLTPLQHSHCTRQCLHCNTGPLTSLVCWLLSWLIKYSYYKTPTRISHYIWQTTMLHTMPSGQSHTATFVVSLAFLCVVFIWFACCDQE